MIYWARCGEDKPIVAPFEEGMAINLDRPQMEAFEVAIEPLEGPMRVVVRLAVEEIVRRTLRLAFSG